ncbi:hypothetical protein Lal_00021439 [Lupinus albus]|nr:hypothetical protein Lal_00021439 [Lupinus albus]
MGVPIVYHLQIPEAMHHSLKASVSDFMHDSNWIFPYALAARISNLICILPSISNYVDEIISQSGIQRNWCKLIWSKTIPPSKSFTT